MVTEARSINKGAGMGKVAKWVSMKTYDRVTRVKALLDKGVCRTVLAACKSVGINETQYHDAVRKLKSGALPYDEYRRREVL